MRRAVIGIFPIAGWLLCCGLQRKSSRDKTRAGEIYAVDRDVVGPRRQMLCRNKMSAHGGKPEVMDARPK